MRFLLAIAILVTLSLSSGAGAEEVTRDKFCSTVYKLAETVMRNRQDGAPMPEMMKAAAGDEISREVIVAAYENPRFSGAKYKKNATQDFANDVYAQRISGS